MVLVGTIRYYLKNIYARFDNFWVLESNGIRPQILSDKITIFSKYYEDRWWGGDGKMQVDENLLKSDAFH